MATARVICFCLLATSLLASTAHSQGDTKPLDLTVSPSIGFPVAGGGGATPTSAPAAGTASTVSKPSSTTPAGSASSTPASVNTAPGVYYGDTSGAIVAAGAAGNPDDAAASCDDASYNKAQVHGSVGMGVVAGNHVAGSYQTGTVNITKPLGDCKHPTGSMSITVGGSQSRFEFPHRGH